MYRIQYCLCLFKFIIIIVSTEFLNFYHIHVRFEFYFSIKYYNNNNNNNNNIQATISVFRLVKNMSVNAKSVEFHQCHAKLHSICFFYHNINESLSRFVDNSDLKVHALHYANELLVRVRLFFQKLLQTRSTWRNNTDEKMFKSTDHDKPHFHSYVFMFFTTISTSKEMFFFFFRARAEKGIARHIGASSVV